MKKKRVWTLCTALALSALLLIGCGASSLNNSSGYSTATVSYDSAEAETAANEYGYTTEAAEEITEYEYDTDYDGDYEYTDVTEESTSERKLIRTVDMSVESTSYDSTLTAIKSQVSASGGYVEYIYSYNGSSYSSYRSTRSSDLTLRIPAENLDTFLSAVSDICNVISSNESVTDVTLTYVDLESRIKILETEQERLIELLEEAESVEDILIIEERLSEVQYELESKESTKRTYGNQINYSTVTLYLKEVQELTPTVELTVWERISQGFMDSVEGLAEDVSEAAIWIIIHLPYLVAWGIVLFIVILIVRRHRRRRGETSGKRAKKDKKEDGKTESSRGDAGKTADSGKKEDTT
ncbi:MAG: DUF4349 domain-containing protein [Lachnospiraceae bacterium]|nr:DUF4349 domain-containing protein [Lachnospiraceae bacterium]